MTLSGCATNEVTGRIHISIVNEDALIADTAPMYAFHRSHTKTLKQPAHLAREIAAFAARH